MQERDCRWLLIPPSSICDYCEAIDDQNDRSNDVNRWSARCGASDRWRRTWARGLDSAPSDHCRLARQPNVGPRRAEVPLGSSGASAEARTGTESNVEQRALTARQRAVARMCRRHPMLSRERRFAVLHRHRRRRSKSRRGSVIPIRLATPTAREPAKCGRSACRSGSA